MPENGRFPDPSGGHGADIPTARGLPVFPSIRSKIAEHNDPCPREPARAFGKQTLCQSNNPAALGLESFDEWKQQTRSCTIVDTPAVRATAIACTRDTCQ